MLQSLEPDRMLLDQLKMVSLQQKAMGDGIHRITIAQHPRLEATTQKE